MVLDGRALAAAIFEDIRVRVTKRGLPPVLAIITCAPNFETQKYLALKEKKAGEVGIQTRVIELPATSETEAFVNALKEAEAISDGVVVQLPLPNHVDVEYVLNSIPETHDIDALNPRTTRVLSPVVGALREILAHHEITASGKSVTIIGNGKLVGMPATRWFRDVGANVTVVTKDTEEILKSTKTADIIVCGAGVPGFLTPDMVKEGVIILDAGTSEAQGVLRGDADPSCAEKATLFTPVPGGIGPITIAVLLKNLVEISE